MELVRDIRGVDYVERIVVPKLRGGALSVYRRLTCDQRFISCRLHPRETVNEYLCDLQDLVRLVEGGLSDRWLICVCFRTSLSCQTAIASIFETSVYGSTQALSLLVCR